MVQAAFLIYQSDFSFGKEHSPVRCFNTFDQQKIPILLQYSTFSECPKVLLERYEGCDCQGDCTESSCLCIQKSKRGRSYNQDNQLIAILEKREEDIPIFECNSNCKCRQCLKSCSNSLITQNLTPSLELVKTEMKGWAVRAGQNIKIAAFISEYIGEIISLSEARRREVIYRARKKGNYLLIFREWLSSYNKVLCTAIDATNLGNISRFYNHSCDPNIGVFAVRVDNILPRVCFFALRDIEKGEELCFSYTSLKNGVDKEEPLPKELEMVRCYCGAINCVKYLPNDTFNEH